MNTNANTQYVKSMDTLPVENKCVFVGDREHVGQFESDFYAEFTCHVLRSSLGAPVSTLVGGETVVYKHVFNELQTKPSYTIQQVFGEQIKNYAGFIFQGWELGVKMGETVSFNFNGMAQSQVDATIVTPTFETNCPLNFAMVSLCQIAGVSILPHITNVEIKYTNGLDSFYGLGSNDPRVMYTGLSKVTGKLTLKMETATKQYIDDHISATNRSFELIVTGAALGVASNQKLRVLIPQTNFSKVGKKLDENINVFELDFEAVQDNATSSQITVEVTNLLATI
jgi:hypothetical protein